MELETEVANAIGAVQQLLEKIKDTPGTSARSLAVARTQFETAFLWVANAAGGEGIFDGK
ncbi:hypothetical protein [Novosphingobium sp. NDB2Meth1]|uniref:hypothetical protein n=1 Tax=Novosphingobium sp. NDB2Meth1 TaxID=1892847 RepID=UPI0009312DA7|nr:hypothetical protein [Novosphingobium sp. NDB2Meth1]